MTSERSRFDQKMSDNMESIRAAQSLNEEIAASRVTILDSHEINDYLIQIIKVQLGRVFNYVPNWAFTKFNQEVDALLRLFMFQQSFRKYQGTFVQNMFQLKYSDVSTQSPTRTSLFILSNVLADYVKEKSDEISIYLRGQNKGVYLTYKYLDIALDVLKLGNFLLFLNQGRYYSLLERCFQMRLVSRTKAPRSIEYAYLSRELLYQSLTELLLVLIPLLQSHLLLRKITNWFSTQQPDDAIIQKETPVLTLSTRCNGCKQYPWQPYHIECRHVFCYYCLIANCKLSDEKYECCICFHTSDAVHSFATKSIT